MASAQSSSETKISSSPWRDFAPGWWQNHVDVREFIQKNYTPYEGDEKFLAGPTERTRKLWEKLLPLLAEEREKGVLAVSQVPSGILAHAPGYIDKEPRSSSACRPMRRSSGRSCRSAAGAWSRRASKRTASSRTRRSPRSSPSTARPTTTACSTPTLPTSRSAAVSHIITGLPDNYGRGRIIGDYRRVALYGVDFLIKDKERDKAELDDRHSTEEVIRLREELAEQIRSLKELKQMGKNYGFDICGPASNAREATQWLYFGYLAGIKQQNGAAMSVGRVSTFLDIYFERDLREGTLTEWQAQEIIDDFVIKLRLVRFLRAPEYNQLFSGDPVWATDVVGGMGDDGRTLVTKSNFRMLNTLYTLGPGAGAEHDHLLVDAAARRFQAIRRQVCDRHQRGPVRERRPHAAEVGRRLRHRLLRLGDAARQADAVLRRPREHGQEAALCAERRPRRDDRRAGRAEARARHRRVLTTTR